MVAPLSILGVWEDEFRKFADYDYSLAVLEGTEVVYVEILGSSGGPPLPSQVGGRLPAHERAWCAHGGCNRRSR